MSTTVRVFFKERVRGRQMPVYQVDAERNEIILKLVELVVFFCSLEKVFYCNEFSVCQVVIHITSSLKSFSGQNENVLPL